MSTQWVWTRLFGMGACVVVTLALLVSTPVSATNPRIVTGTIYTADDANPVVEAVVIDAGKYSFVGSLEGAIAFAQNGASIRKLGTDIAYPGFVEGHGHFASLGRALISLDLSKPTTFTGMVDQVAQATASTPENAVILGRGWHQSKWTKAPSFTVGGFPTHRALSEVSPNHPVVLEHANGHTLMLNAKAMSVLGINKLTTAPEGGVVVRDTRGMPTGILHETAMALAAPLTVFTVESATRALIAAQDHAIKQGITAFHDAGIDATEVEAQQTFDQDKKLKIRLFSMISASDPVLTEHWLNTTPLVASEDSRLTLNAFKVVMDGALGSRTAWLHEPYTDEPTTVGLQTADADRLAKLMERSRVNGWQINTHAIGDRANSVVLDTIESVMPEGGDHRFRIEHSQHLRPEDIERFARLGVTASIQTIHLSSDRPWAIDRLGPERIEEGAYLWRSLIDSGVHIANGTDVPVEPINPIANFYAAVTRKTLAGLPSEGFESDQRMTRAEALLSLTQWNAYAVFMEDTLGSISVGKAADMTVLSQDIMTVDESLLLDTEVTMTVIGGEIVYHAQAPMVTGVTDQ